MTDTGPTTQQRVADQSSDLADSAVRGIQALSPADKSWVAAFCIIVGIIVGADAWVAIRTLQDNRENTNRLTDYLISVETNRSEALERLAQSFSDQQRRSQEIIRELTQTVARDSERAGMAALSAIDRRSDEGLIDSVREPVNEQ